MNCNAFHRLLHEYVDESLETAAKARAGEHLLGCAACRSAVERERAIGGAIRAALHQRSAHLTLGAGFHERVQRRLAREGERAPWWIGWRWVGALRLHPLAATAAVLLIFALWAAFHDRLFSVGPARNAPPSVPMITWVIRVPLPAGAGGAFVITDTPSRQVFRERDGALGNQPAAPGLAFGTVPEPRR